MSPINKLSKTQTILVIDPSSEHLAYTIAEINLEEKNLHIWTTGMLFTPASWPKGKRFTYMLKALEVIFNANPIKSAVYTEQFFSNPGMMMGSAVVPTVNGIIELCAYKESPTIQKIQYSEISPSSWRSILQIKPDLSPDLLKTGVQKLNKKGLPKIKKDFKEPTKRTVEKMLNYTMPEEIISNLNDKKRKIPYDVTDCLAITLAIAKDHGIINNSIDERSFFNFNLHEHFKMIAEEI